MSPPPDPPADDASPEQPFPYAPALFIYVKIPVAGGAVDALEYRNERIDQLLREAGVGTVLGWGSSLGDERPDGTRPVEFHRIDIEVDDLAAARAALRHILADLGAPAGTEIHNQTALGNREDICAPPVWLLEQPLGDD